MWTFNDKECTCTENVGILFMSVCLVNISMWSSNNIKNVQKDVTITEIETVTEKEEGI
jgi:hypothetical protein